MQDEKLEEVASKLWAELYEEPFRGKPRGRFVLTREQMRKALGVEKLHASTIERLQDAALKKGLVIVDLDDVFPCIESHIVRKYRRPPASVFAAVFPFESNDDDVTGEDDDD